MISADLTAWSRSAEGVGSGGGDIDDDVDGEDLGEELWSLESWVLSLCINSVSVICTDSKVAIVSATKLAGRMTFLEPSNAGLTPLTERFAIFASTICNPEDGFARYGYVAAQRSRSAISSLVRFLQGSRSMFGGNGELKKVRKLPLMPHRLVQSGIISMMSARSWCALRGMLTKGIVIQSCDEKTEGLFRIRAFCALRLSV